MPTTAEERELLVQLGFPAAHYKKGDVVWVVVHDTEVVVMPCPDCNGTKKWKLCSPAGSEYEFDCPHCSSGHLHRPSDGWDARVPSLRYQVTKYKPHMRTVRAIERDGHSGSGFDHKYFMEEDSSGGSGFIYSPERIFATKEQAQAHCDEINAKAEVDRATRPEAIRAKFYKGYISAKADSHLTFEIFYRNLRRARDYRELLNSMIEKQDEWATLNDEQLDRIGEVLNDSNASWQQPIPLEDLIRSVAALLEYDKKYDDEGWAEAYKGIKDAMKHLSPLIPIALSVEGPKETDL